jgi:pimeloyl-ACP methyl ester carboxylesterase
MNRKILLGLSLLGTVVVIVVGMLTYRAWRQHEIAQTLAIATPNGIDEEMFVKIGGIDQYIQIRGDDRANPVILFLHGGPGISMIGLTPIFHAWEQHFTIVQWDQRGTGKTYGRNGRSSVAGSMTIDRMTKDGLEVVNFLRAHLHKDKIVLLGHSWGTVLGVRMIKLQPESFSAYVATGELVAKQENEAASYEIVLQRARAAHDAKAIRELEEIHPPPYRHLSALLVQRKWLDAYDIVSEREIFSTMMPVVAFAPNYSLLDIYDMQRATSFSQQTLYDEVNNFDSRELGIDFEVPYFIFEGDEDINTPTELAQHYFATIHAPAKDFFLLKGGGHSAVITMSDEFLKALVSRVRPLVTGATR